MNSKDTATPLIITNSLHDALPIFRHLDREEFKPVLVIGAGDAVGAQQRLLADLEPDHGELAVAETERGIRSEEHTSELQSPCNLVCRLLLGKKKTKSVK